MGIDYLGRANGDNRWEGYTWAKVYRDASGNPFPCGLAMYQVFHYNTCIGYAETETKADSLFLNYKFGQTPK